MNVFACAALSLCLVQSVHAQDDSTYSFFSPTHGKAESHSIPITNSGSMQIEDIKVQADCGCVHIEKVPQKLKAGETQCIVFSIAHPDHDERKVNVIAVKGKPDFQDSIKVVNYFYSEHPQIFGQTVVHLSELPSPPPLVTTLIIGDSTIKALTVRVESQDRAGICSFLSDASELEKESGCFKRVLRIKLNLAALFLSHKEMIYIRAAETGKQILISAE